MDRQRWLDLAGFAAVGCSAYFSGAAWYINLVHVPTLFETVHDTKTLLEEWRLCYSLSRKYQVPIFLKAEPITIEMSCNITTDV